MTLLWQVFGSAIVCYLGFMIGFMFTWPSSTIDLFASEANTTLSRAMSDTEVALLGSLSSVGALLSTPIYGYILDKIGRRYSMIIAGIPYVISWTIIASSKQVEVILAAMFLSGIGGAAFLVTPVYVSEICQDSIRGTMTAGTIIFMGLGTLASYITGGYLPYHVNVYFQLTVSIVYMVLVYFIRESPLFLLQNGLDEEAAKSIAFYRSLKPDSKEVLDAIHNIKCTLSTYTESKATDTEEGVTQEEKDKLNKDNHQKKVEKISPWKFLVRSKSSLRALGVCLALVTASIFTGLVIVQVYAQPLFSKVVPGMSASLCSIIFAVVCITANVVSAYFVDIAGRRVLMLASAVASGVCTLLFGTQLHLEWGPSILTPIFIYAFCIVYSMGAGSIPFVLIAEMFLPEVKSICSMLVIEWAWLTNFAILLIYYPLVTAIGLGPVFYIFSAISFGNAAFCYFYLPETKGLSVDVIQGLLLGKTTYNTCSPGKLYYSVSTK